LLAVVIADFSFPSTLSYLLNCKKKWRKNCQSAECFCMVFLQKALRLNAQLIKSHLHYER